jgi:hypothetical protein
MSILVSRSFVYYGLIKNGTFAKKDILNGIVAFVGLEYPSKWLIISLSKRKIKPPTALIGFYFGKKVSYTIKKQW